MGSEEKIGHGALDSDSTTPGRSNAEPQREATNKARREETTNKPHSEQNGHNGEEASRRQDRDIEKDSASTTPPDRLNMPEKDPNLVLYDGPDDRENPLNWPRWRKWCNSIALTVLVSWVTFSTAMFSAAIPVMSLKFHVPREVMRLGTSLPLFGFVAGPSVWGPLSEVYGRKYPLFIGYAIFVIFNIPTALAQNPQTFLVSRFLTGFFGCATLAIIGGAIADLWEPVDRGVAITIVSAASLASPAISPVIGGFLADSFLGWRWIAWIELIGSSTFGVVAFFVTKESYSPILLQRRAAKLRLKTRNWALHSPLDEEPPNWRELVVKYILRPAQMLMLEPILLLITIYISFVYGLLYLFFGAVPIAFVQLRGWSIIGVAELPFIAFLIGVITGAILPIISTKTVYARTVREKGSAAPEARLPPMIAGGFLLPAGIFLFAWTSSAHISWVPQVLAGGPIGLAIQMIFVQGLNYIIDVYPEITNSAIAAHISARSLVAGGFPLFAPQMFRNLGICWAGTIIALLTVLMIPIPIVFFYKGERIRAMSKFIR